MERWDLVCDRDFHFKTISQSVFFVGHFFGALIAGLLADWFGRKRSFIMILLPGIGIFLASYFVDDPYSWVVLRFFVGLINMAATTIKSVYAVSLHWIYLKFQKRSILSRKWNGKI
jgi:MFS family permease